MSDPFDDIHHIPGKAEVEKAEKEFVRLMTKENVMAAILSMAATHTLLVSDNDRLKADIDGLRRELVEAEKRIAAGLRIIKKSDASIRHMRRINRRLMDNRRRDFTIGITAFDRPLEDLAGFENEMLRWSKDVVAARREEQDRLGFRWDDDGEVFDDAGDVLDEILDKVMKGDGNERD